MNFPYPKNKAVKLLALALLVAGTLQAQQAASYAANKSSPGANTVRRVDASISIMARSEKKIMLGWMSFEGAVSHYVLERSANGRLFEEAAVFFTGEWGQEPAYTYTDHFKRSVEGLLYYRLRVIGLDGSEVYTQPTLSEMIR